MTLALLPSLAAAQSPPAIERVRVGLPAGQDAGCTRNGAWAPVAVTLRGGAGGNPQGTYRLRFETTDLEEVTYEAGAAVPAIAGESLRTVTGYIVPGGDGATFRVRLETADGAVVRSQTVPAREFGRDLVLGPRDVMFFGAGAALSPLRRAAEKIDNPEGKDNPDRGHRRFGHADDVAELPDRWLGYDAADVVVLGTGKRDFVLQLALEAESARRNALLEWVRRGGRLVVSVGRNRQEVAQLLAKMPLLDVKVTGGDVVKSLPVVSTQWAERFVHQAPLSQVEVAALTVGPGVNVLVREQDGRRPVIVQGSCGLGRVVLVAFDLDGPPFTTWEGQEAFWARLHKELAPDRPARDRGKQAGDDAPGGFVGASGSDENDLRAQLKRGLESFAETPTVSFGWVALFILLYILLVGPIDYFILKKLFKRLELTWVTFPLTVIAVSAAAYFTAYALKGDDLRMNKIDLVDIDLHEPRQAYGTTWFSLLSPRVASYTVGLEPAEGWAAPAPEGAPGPVLTLLEAGDRGFRAGSQGLFRRPYLYADEAAGLSRVPVPVWATRSFTAAWRAPLPGKDAPVGVTDDVGPLRRARGGRGLAGRITNNLPVRLQDVTLFYRERWYSLGRLEPGESRRVDPLFAGDAQGQNHDLAAWFADYRVLAPGAPVAPTGRPLSANLTGHATGYQQMKLMMFFRAAENARAGNSGLRRLDQSWRLRVLPEYPVPDRPRHRDEAILVARTPLVSDAAEAVAEHPASASRLWLGELPAAGRPRPKLPGFLTQETYLRVFIPVQ